MSKTIEILAPAGNREKLETVYHYGADAAYIGLKNLNLRKFADNFSDDEIPAAVALARTNGKKIYLALNVIPFNNDLDEAVACVKNLATSGLDGVIVSDLGMLDVVRENSNLDVHVSTQASNTNWRTVRQWQRLGAKRVVLARELPLDDIRRIKDAVPEMELEAFVHGAMCIAFSGHCLMSAHMANRDANSGGCAQSCRWKYSVVEETRTNESFPVIETERGTFVFNSRDLCALPFLDKLIDAGVESLKIEGRVKGIHYAATTTKVYREAVELLKQGRFECRQEWMDELASASNRGFTSGFFLGKPNHTGINHEWSGYSSTHVMAAKVLDQRGPNEFLLGVRHHVDLRSGCEHVPVFGAPYEVQFSSLVYANNKQPASIVNPNDRVLVCTTSNLQAGDLIRQRVRA